MNTPEVRSGHQFASAASFIASHHPVRAHLAVVIHPVSRLDHHQVRAAPGFDLVLDVELWPPEPASRTSRSRQRTGGVCRSFHVVIELWEVAERRCPPLPHLGRSAKKPIQPQAVRPLRGLSHGRCRSPKPAAHAYERSAAHLQLCLAELQ